MSRELFEQILKWRLDSKLEDTDRYFYPTSDVEKIEKGDRSYVIGRKGTGKTAISEYLRKQNRYNRFSEKLSFKNFPFNDLYDQKDERFRNYNQYITLWKYITYIEIVRMMWRNENISNSLRQKLNEIFIQEPKHSLARSISYWTSGEFSLNILAQGASLKTSREIVPNNTPLIERVRILEDIIKTYIDANSYYIVFDELDEDYSEILSAGRYGQYISLLTGLFKAVQDIKSLFPERDYNIYPVIFLRNDIFTLMRDADKTKWRDLTIELEWNPEKIKRLLAFRISRAVDTEGPILDFGKAWQLLFATTSVPSENGSSRSSIFEYITGRTQIRPRDYISYIQACVENTIEQDKLRAGPNIVRKVEKSFSQYLRSETEDEIYSVLPEISQILDLLTYIGKPVFSFYDFEAVYSREVVTDQVPRRNPESVLKTLFLFNVIGNQIRHRNFQIYRYLNKDAFLNINHPICVHKGLHKALQVF